MNNDKKWSGRFSEPVAKLVKEYTASINFDKRLALYDIEGSLAHAKMLYKVGVLSKEDLDKIIKGMDEIINDIKNNTLDWSIELEDIHMNIESRLINKIGDAGKKLHTGRSRNDQVATDIRLWLRAQIDDILKKINLLQKSLLSLAKKNITVVMPGFTHLQVAQPISFAHHILAYINMFSRDYHRLIDCRKRVNCMPLGSAALAGTTYPIDRNITKELLNFEGVCENSLDAVSDRDFLIEFLSCASIMMVHFSRISEELILWMNPSFGFITLEDKFCTGSSIMPQKKNPDVPELVRGKTGRVVGHLMTLLMLMKAQPLAYNKDNQEDKEPVFDVVDTISNTLTIYTDMVSGIIVNQDNMKNALKNGYATATDLADYLVKKGLPFRDSHEVVARIVKLAEEKSCDLDELKLDEMKKYSALIEKDIFAYITLIGSVNSRNHIGGTAFQQIEKQIAKWNKLLNE